MEEVRLKRRLELIWWGFTAVAVIAVLLPVWMQTRGFPFFLANAAYIVIAITFARYSFFLRHTFLAHTFWPKFVIIAMSAILIFVLTTAFGDFANYLDEIGLQSTVTHLPVAKQYRVMHYIRGEMVFFGVASIVGAVILPVRMIISIWRMRNRGTV